MRLRRFGLRLTAVVGLAAMLVPMLSVDDAHSQPAHGAAPAKPANNGAQAAPQKKTAKGAAGGGADAGAGDGGADAAAVRPTSESEISTAVWDAGVSTYVPPPRKVVPPPPPPSAEQVHALEQMQAEATEYEKSAKDYRDAITRIVQQHYEDKRRRTLAALDGEIDVEKKALREAREEAIKRLEEFVARYQGPNANPEETPDAMFRLAALYEERARSDSPDDLGVGLKPAIALYKRLLHEFPQYRELAGVYYYLGHALNDSNRIDEAQQVWRSLVCHNKYPYPVPTDPKDPDKDTLVALPQDHDEDFWRGWEAAHPTPVGFGKKAATPTFATKKKPAKEPAPTEGETVYVSPYPDECVAVPQKIEEGQEPRYVAEVWWQIGNWHFDQLDPHGGPYNLNRASTAYLHAMKFKKPPLYGVSMYKLAWTYFKQQRYETAVHEFVNLLTYTDEQEKLTGDPGTDFRSEAYTYIAGSLTYLDFQGPAAEEPFIARNDVLDTESNPTVAEQKMHVAIDRVQDAKLVPQDRKWSVEVYKGLAMEFREVNQWHNAIETDELILKKWPMHRDAPAVQNEIADIYDELTRLSRDGTSEREQNSARALEARTKLAAYVGSTPWVDANRDDPEAIQNAEKLVKGGLRRAAADHTNLARALAQKAQETSDTQQQRVLLDRALGEYKLADIGWTGYLRQDENAPDAYESKFWIADARHGAIVVAVALGQDPPAQAFADARQAAVDVRDSNEDDRFLQPAAYYVVDIAEQQLNAQYGLFQRSNGTQGIEKRDNVKFAQGSDGKEVPVRDPLPPAVQFAIQAREEYVARVSPAMDVTHAIAVYQFQAADFFFLYGQWADAKARFEPIWKDHCGKDEWSYKAWERLVTMAARSLDVEGSRALAKAEEEHSCAVNEEQKKQAAALIAPVKVGGYFIDAEKLFEEAQKMPDGPERNKKWRAAAEAFQEALKNGPAHDAAPEAAMNGAFAWKQIGEYDKAIAMYELFIANYGAEKNLKKLQDEKSPKYQERVGYLKQAYDTLSKSYVLFFNYRKAAETYDKISQIDRFEEKDRRDAARNALILYSNIGDSAKMDDMRARFVKLGASAEDKAEADFIVAASDFKQWDPGGQDDGANRQARLRATQAMARYYDANKGNTAAVKYVVEAAYDVAKMGSSAGDKKADDWWKKTIDAFQKYKATAPTKDGKSEALGSRQAAFAAEGEYTMLDEEIHSKFDYDTGHHRYAGTAVEVIKKYQGEAGEAKKLHDRLQHVIDEYASPEWAVAAIARQGSLYDALRTGLYNTRAPQLKLFDAKTEKLLEKFANSDNPDDQDKVDQIRQQTTEAWRAARERELNGADEIMVTRYAQSVVLSRRYNVRNPAVSRAIQRLAFFTDILGEGKMKQYATNVQGLDYHDGLFLQSRPGMLTEPKVQPMPSPLPVVP